MSTIVIVIVVAALLILLALIAAEMPIWIALAASGTIGLIALSGTGIAYSTLAQTPYSATANYALVVIPMFVLMGIAAHKAGLAKDIFTVAQRVTRRLPGGLGVATILACGGFAAVSGSSVATVATIGRISVDQMTRQGYRANAAAALVALGACLGVLIPPSILMVVYGILSGESIGRLLLAGVIPGLLSMVFYAVAVVLFYRRGYFKPKTEKEIALYREYATTLERTAESAQSSGEGVVDSVKSRSTATKVRPAAEGGALETTVNRQNVIGTVYIAILFVIVIGGMYSGLFTSTEAAAVAAVVALVILIVRLLRKGMKGILVGIKDALIESASMTTMIFALLFGGTIFAFFLLKSGVPSAIANAVVSAQLPPILVIIVSLVMLLILGALMDELSIMLIVVPLLWPVIDQMGIDGVWYGVLVIKATSVGLIAPPVGINVFVASGVSKHVSADAIYRAILPFFLVELAVIALLILVPGISTLLPNLMLGS